MPPQGGAMRGQPPVPNVDLARLHDLVMPPAVSYAPSTVGWYILGALLIVALAWLVSRWLAHRRARRYRRDALRELAAIEARLRGAERAAAFIELDVLIKRVALAAYSRADVAALSGDAWLSFLDHARGGRTFTSGDGRALGELPYTSIEARQSVSAERTSALVDAVRDWIEGHRVPV